jgi:hypothetical protein
MPLTGITPGTKQFRLRVTLENRADGKRQWKEISHKTRSLSERNGPGNQGREKLLHRKTFRSAVAPSFLSRGGVFQDRCAKQDRIPTLLVYYGQRNESVPPIYEGPIAVIRAALLKG